MPRLLHKELTGSILGAYYAVYNGTSRTYPEWIYENGMAKLLRREGIRYSRQPAYEIVYKERVVGRQQLDILVVDAKVVIECKVAACLELIHKAQLFSYLKTVGAQVGLLLNFGGSEPEFQRLYFDPKQSADDGASYSKSRELPEGLLHPRLTGEVLDTAIEVHRALGPGFIHRVYANACYQEYRLRGIGAKPCREYQVIFQGESLGSLKFAHFLVEDAVMHFPVAIRDVADVSIHNLKDWMRHQGVSLGVLTNFYETAIHSLFIRA